MVIDYFMAFKTIGLSTLGGRKPCHLLEASLAYRRRQKVAGTGAMMASINRLLLRMWCASPSRWIRKAAK